LCSCECTSVFVHCGYTKFQNQIFIGGGTK
jgi:hypothetical protein